MLKVVSNTTPLIALSMLNRLELLQQLYTKVFISTAVYDEFEAGKNKSFYKNLSKMEWVNILEIQNKQALNYLLDLDVGEAEAIVLAKELKADLIILDEKLSRFHAKHAGLNVIGTIGILIKAKKQGLIVKIEPLLDELIQNGFWISEKLKKEILIRLKA